MAGDAEIEVQKTVCQDAAGAYGQDEYLECGFAAMLPLEKIISDHVYCTGYNIFILGNTMFV